MKLASSPPASETFGSGDAAGHASRHKSAESPIELPCLRGLARLADTSPIVKTIRHAITEADNFSAGARLPPMALCLFPRNMHPDREPNDAQQHRNYEERSDVVHWQI